MRKYMHYFIQASAILIIISLVMLSPKCKDPDEFDPGHDTLVAPPEPPVPQSPSDYVFMPALDEYPTNIYIPFTWSALEDADFYELEIVFGSALPTITTCAANSTTVVLRDSTGRIGYEHHWRVRASASGWEWYTDWSDQLHYEVRWQPYGPAQLSPPDGSTVLIDSLPFIVELQWDVIQDEEFYEVEFYQGDSLIDLSNITGNSYWAYIEDTTEYRWRVRAGSQKWEKYSYWSPLWRFYTAFQ